MCVFGALLIGHPEWTGGQAELTVAIGVCTMEVGMIFGSR
jgi:hypothetical protein